MNDVQKTGSDSAERPGAKTSARRADLRARLVAAGRAAVAEGGLQNLKARDLAAAAGCAVGAIYNVFDDLDDLILRIGADTLARLEQGLAAPPGPAPEPAEELLRLACGYFSFARADKALWRALFEHRLAGGRPAPAWYLEDQSRLFALVEAPLARLLPDEPASSRALLARTLFSAVHGVVSLGLEEKLAPMPEAILEAELERLVRAFAAGLTLLPPG
ncbi:TetR/AcrR family transcriptional regulator [Methylosinus sporium]|uniref:TetR family transcriptional regulator n=1 Tax=Methylosinus sporium TaxID=428 RepID=A0A2U1SMN0_METSR|nr:TetR-like C-terminal domain-containing protein [Methylosinus sporium]PWB92867.1 TetR family transcriptional regulator [Methylosinus sporium]